MALGRVKDTSTLRPSGAIAYFVSLVSNAFLAHYNAPSVLTALAPQPAGEAARAGAPEEEAAPSWLAVRLRRAAEINEEFAEYARRLSPPLLRRLRIGGGKGGDEGGGGKGGGGKGGGGVAAYEAAEGESGGQLAAYRRVVLSAFGLSAVLFVAIGAAGASALLLLGMSGTGHVRDGPWTCPQVRRATSHSAPPRTRTSSTRTPRRTRLRWWRGSASARRCCASFLCSRGPSARPSSRCSSCPPPQQRGSAL